MFKKTRRRIVASVMAILVVVFAAVLIGIYAASYYQAASRNRDMLKTHAAQFTLQNYLNENQFDDFGSIFANEPKPGGFGGRDILDTHEYRLSSFYSVVIYSDGTMFVAENGEEIYTDEELMGFTEKINAKSSDAGTLDSLMYYKADKGEYTLVTFLDNSITKNSFSSLLKSTLVGGIAAIVIFFFISVKLAKMIVNPVEESYTKQKQFISDAGHELKTPVSVVSANAELLSREIGDNQWLSNIQYENERMGSLVTQLLELARTENVVPQTETLDFSRLVSGESLPFESVMFERGFIFDCEIEDGLTVHGNPTQLRQVTAILLDNAVTHAYEKGEIKLRLIKEHGCAQLSVINDGDEIPAAQRKNIFERFYRMDDARTESDNHYGLGLAIAKAIVTAHHGKIDVRCYDKKVEFRVRIPLE